MWSRGLEWNAGTRLTNGKWSVFVNASGNYALTTSQKSKKEGDASIGKQLIFVPTTSMFFNAGMSFSGIFINYNHTYTGYRYTTSDNTSFLEPYQTGNISFSGIADFKPVRLHITMQFYNIWNQKYEIVPSHPMPGRYFRVGVSFEFKKNLNNKTTKP